MRIASYSLVLSLILSVVIFIVVNSSVMDSLIYSTSIINYRENIKYSLNSISGVYMGMNMNIENQNRSSMLLFQEGTDSVQLVSKKWGYFNLLTSHAIKNGSIKASKTALVGSNFDRSLCLVLSNTNRPLSLAGRTLIEGDCLLPKLGVKRAYIEGKNFQEKKLINGNSKHNPLTSIHDKYKLESTPITNGIFKDTDSILYYSSDIDSIINSFSNSRIILLCNGENDRISGYYKGNVIIYSNHDLEFGANIKLSDVLVIANNISIKSSNIGAAQYYAHNNIECLNSNLEYPSLLVVKSKSSHLVTEDASGISIRNSTIDGGVYLELPKSQTKKISGVTIDKKSLIRGQVISNSWIDLRGHIFGQVITNYFYLKTPSSVYENHLLDATISNKNMPTSFPLLVRENSETKSIAKWLD